MSLLVAFLAISGALLWVAIAGAVIFGVFFRGATAEDRATVDLPDVDATEHAPFTVVPPMGSNVVHLGHDRATCDACTGADRGAF